MYAPIALFAFRRPDHTKLVIDALLLNDEAPKTEIYIYCDGPRNDQDIDFVSQVREYVRTVKGFKAIYIIEREKNYGLANSIIAGVTEILEKYENIIVLEDDILTSPFFLRYMNAGLLKYKNENRVASIHGYVYPVEKELPSTFFLKGADCWGWATWRRAWKKFNPNGIELLNKLKKYGAIDDFDFHGAYHYSDMLLKQIKGQNQSWAIRWHASMYLENMLTLYPGKTLVNNIGHDDSGTHSGRTNQYDSDINRDLVELRDIKIEVSKEAYFAFENFMRKNNQLNFKKQKNNKFKSLIRSILPPVILQIYRKLFTNNLPVLDNNSLQDNNEINKIIFTGEYITWEDALNHSSGYVNTEILDKVISSSLKVVRGEAAYERDSVLFDDIQYSWPVLTGLFLASSLGNGRLSVMDFGGSLGSSYYQNRKFLNLLNSVKWHVIEQPNYVEAGNKYFKNDVLKFFNNIKDSTQECKPNVVLLSSVLQYLPKPYEQLVDLIKLNANVIVLDRTCYHKNPEVNLLSVQRIPDNIYSGSYPCWFLIENQVIELLENNNYFLIESFPALDDLDDRAVWKGHIFCRNANG